MCNHQWRKVNDCYVCINCGLTRVPEGRIFYDKYLNDYDLENGGKKSGKKKTTSKKNK